MLDSWSTGKKEMFALTWAPSGQSFLYSHKLCPCFIPFFWVKCNKPGNGFWQWSQMLPHACRSQLSSFPPKKDNSIQIDKEWTQATPGHWEVSSSSPRALSPPESSTSGHELAAWPCWPTWQWLIAGISFCCGKCGTDCLGDPPLDLGNSAFNLVLDIINWSN